MKKEEKKRKRKKKRKKNSAKTYREIGTTNSGKKLKAKKIIPGYVKVYVQKYFEQIINLKDKRSTEKFIDISSAPEQVCMNIIYSSVTSR